MQETLFDISKKLEERKVHTASFSHRMFWVCWFDCSLSVIEQDAKDAEAKTQHILGQLTSVLIGKGIGSSFSETHDAKFPSSSFSPLNTIRSGFETHPVIAEMPSSSCLLNKALVSHDLHLTGTWSQQEIKRGFLVSRGPGTSVIREPADIYKKSFYEYASVSLD